MGGSPETIAVAPRAMARIRPVMLHELERLDLVGDAMEILISGVHGDRKRDRDSSDRSSCDSDRTEKIYLLTRGA